MTKKENDAKHAPIKGFAEIELGPDAWPRFEKFIRDIAKAGPQHWKPIENPKAKAGAKASRPGKRGRQKSMAMDVVETMRGKR
jgi:hypothetical protein